MNVLLTKDNETLITTKCNGILIDNKINSIKKRILKPDNEEFCFS